ncbi:MAG: hypothetical protein R3E32_09750 [Chitinophagales bacterium]
MGYDYYVKVIGRILVGLYFFLQFASFLLRLEDQKKRLENHKAYLPIRWLQVMLYSVIGLFFVIDFYAQYTAAFAIGLIMFEVLMIDLQGEPFTLYPNNYRFQAILSKIVLIAACLLIIGR